MNIKCTRIVVVLAAFMMVCLSLAQGGGGGGQGRRGGGMFGFAGGPPAMLAFRPDVQTDLGLTDDQKTKLTDITTAMRNAPRPTPGAGGSPEDFRKQMETRMADTAKQINTILTPDQQKRLTEIYVQLNGSRSVINADIASQVEVTADQTAKIKTLNDDMQTANRDLFTKQRNNEISREDAAAAREKNTKALGDEIDKILTADQKSKLEALKGTKTFKADPPRQRGGGGGAGG